MIRHKHILRSLIWLGLAIALLTSLSVGGVAAAQAVSQGYGVTGDIQKGMIVMLDPKDGGKVTPLTNEKSSAMLGVVVSANETVVSLGGTSNDAQVYVATTGKYDVLVSDQNGAIETGDIISISALDGIGMKADAGPSLILGKALGNFDGKTNVNGTATLKTTNGTKTVSIGFVQVDISVSHNPLVASLDGPSVPSFLKNAGQTIAGKPVSAARLYASIGVLLITLFVTGSLLYGGVRSSLISIGRNPLAKRTILRGLVQVIMLGLIVFVIGLVAIYLILKL